MVVIVCNWQFKLKGYLFDPELLRHQSQLNPWMQVPWRTTDVWTWECNDEGYECVYNDGRRVYIESWGSPCHLSFGSFDGRHDVVIHFRIQIFFGDDLIAHSIFKR